MTIHDANVLTREEFVSTFRWIFEHSIAEQVSELRPFPSYQFLHHAMKKRVKKYTIEERVALLQTLPDFIETIRGQNPYNYVGKQSGFRSLTPREYKKFIAYHNKYIKKFGFPFIIAMRGHNKQSVYEALKKRLKNNENEEIEAAIEEIFRIYFYILRESISNEDRDEIKKQSV
ncbi:2-oxo-4-hydroxy-4-carboxy-5-ureidoimidazoline decarboxylase [Metabacillus litoralis]|uniref:2-oxo-4-hydroxy-4-carboxy-5-ureidoimidazoline decarboxylase n=1 Tax=Metabacillus TaxID=2675233 RepID=UPI00204020E1|nr:2-oxo-4-hydroxy-4-carboxy-5-ureidoimidazoline decarboxylase [Metabacillus litoralis]MCM3163919.1 2-oxo-4-hydroxy-4-carboxy-5-ureidoimidazoline decarboxylase [Metabacillus litoralis]